ncbi:hypothetical protein KCU94_g2958, partial [Aureobasidium melanogenum]
PQPVSPESYPQPSQQHQQAPPQFQQPYQQQAPPQQHQQYTQPQPQQQQWPQAPSTHNGYGQESFPQAPQNVPVQPKVEESLIEL